jgi:hypothetical protein
VGLQKQRKKKHISGIQNHATTGWLRLSEKEQWPNRSLKKFLIAVKFLAFAACSAVVSFAIKTCAARIVVIMFYACILIILIMMLTISIFDRLTS